MNIIAIDCGASFVKGGLFRDEILIKTAERRTPKEHTVVQSVVDPVKAKALLSMVTSMCEELGAGLGEAVLCISNEMHGFILVRADGTPYTDYISWQTELDRKNGCPALKDIVSSEDILHTGMPLRRGLPSNNLKCLNDAGLLDHNELYFYTLGDYILAGLSGKTPHIHPTNAAATGLYDLRSGTWNSRMIQCVSDCKVIFPQIGETALDFRLGNLALLALPAIGDQQAAILGAGLKKSNRELSFNLGTGGQASVLTETADVSNSYQIRPFFSKMYLKTVPHIPSGRALNVYVRMVQDILRAYHCDISEEAIWKTMLEEEEHAVGSNIQTDLSFFENSASKHTVGSIENINEYGLTLGNLTRSIFERVAANCILAGDVICPDRTEVEHIFFSGGVARRIPKIRETIMKAYTGCQAYSISENETLTGLSLYALSSNCC